MRFLNKEKIVPALKKFSLFSFPVLLWLFSYRKFYFGKIRIDGDLRDSFIYVNYYLNNIVRGVYPLWNPFVVWGRPEMHLNRQIGELNPFYYFMIVFNKLGLPFTLSYFVCMVSYYCFGLAGFYLLACRTLKNKRAAYVAFLLLLFSAMGSNLFNDVNLILLFTPIVWFFYFLVAFSQTGEKKFFLGLTFSVMIIAITNLPLYFLMLFFVFLTCFCFFFYKELGAVFTRYVRFVRAHKIVSIFCILSIFLSVLPGVLWYKSVAAGDFILMRRVFDLSEAGRTLLPIKVINLSTFVGQNTVEGLISNLKDIRLNSFYIPVFGFLILLLGLVVRINRKSVLFVTVSLLVFLISLANATPIHPFLYKYIPFMGLFRNLHFLPWLGLPVFILFLAEQLRIFLTYSPQGRREKWSLSAYILIIHLGAMLFLCRQENVIISSFFVVGLSFMFFIFYFFRNFKKAEYLTLFLFLVLIALQPLEAFHSLGQNDKGNRVSYSDNPYSQEKKKPVFSFTREPGLDKGDKSSGFMSDTDGFFDPKRYVGMKWSYLLQENIPRDILKKYTGYKFVVYDLVQRIDEEKIDFKQVGQAFAENRNIAFVVSEGEEQLPLEKSFNAAPEAQRITANSEKFQIKAFDLNGIKFETNFSTEKFLVYNDSFHRGWRAYVNGKPMEILRSNVAFKGLWLPAGKNSVLLRFGSLGEHFFNGFLLFFFSAFFIYLVFLFLRRRRVDKSVV